MDSPGQKYVRIIILQICPQIGIYEKHWISFSQKDLNAAASNWILALFYFFNTYLSLFVFSSSLKSYSVTTPIKE